MRQTGSEITSKHALSPQADTGGSAKNGTIIDRLGYDSLVASLITGAITGTPTSMSMVGKVQHGDAANLSDVADVTGATVTITTATAIGEMNVDLTGLKRYVRITETTTFVGGTSPDVMVAASISLGQAMTGPV